MNIVFLCSFPLAAAGGVGRVSETLATQFSRKGHNCYFLAATRGTDDCSCDTPQYFVPSNTTTSIHNKRYVQGFVSDKQIDVIINQSGVSNLDVFELALAARDNSLIFSVHHNCVECLQLMHRQIIDGVLNRFGVPNWMRQPWLYRSLRKRSRARIGQAFERLANEGSRLVLLADAFIPELAIFSKKIELNKVIAIPNPAPFSADVDSIEQKEDRLLFVGRLENGQKRVDRLLRIWDSISKKCPSWKLDIVGEGPDRATLESDAQRLSLERIRFHGPKDPEPFYRRAKLLALTSDFEGYGMVLVEAQAFGCVPVAFECFSSIGSIIENGKNGMIIRGFDVDKYSATILELMQNSSLLLNMATVALEGPDKFGASVISDRWLDSFRFVAANS